MYVEVGTAAAQLAWEHRTKIREIVRKLRRLVGQQGLIVVVFGSGGVGKTTLGKLLSGEFDPTENPRRYIQTIRTESFPLKGDTFGTLLVGPGQQRRRRTNWDALVNRLTAGKAVGVINVVSWGHHSVSGLQSYKEDRRVFTSGMSKEDFVEKFLAENRAEEIVALKEILEPMQRATSNFWMLTVVTKQDLWWDRREDVRDFYERGEYSEVIGSITRARGNRFQHELVSVSLKRENLGTETEVLVPTVAGYDDNLQRLNLAELSNTLKEFLERL